LATSSIATRLAVAHVTAFLLAVLAIPIGRTHALEIATQAAALDLRMARIGQARILPTTALLARESTGALAVVVVHNPRTTQHQGWTVLDNKAVGIQQSHGGTADSTIFTNIRFTAGLIAHNHLLLQEFRKR